MREEIRNPAGERLAYSWTEGAEGLLDVVVIGHGCTSDRDRPWSIALAEALREVGIASLRLAFSGNGESEGRFEDSNVTKEVADLGAVLDALPDRRVSFAGHSMGGAVGVVRASADPRIKTLISLAAITHTRAFVERLFGHLRPGVDCMLGKSHCPLDQTFVDDLTALGSLTRHARTITVPWLLVHGTEDEIVPIQDSADMRSAADEANSPTYVALAGVDHSFSGAGISSMTTIVVPWLERVLRTLP
jgi:uncharacterized protein